jgi:hypothetical protein
MLILNPLVFQTAMATLFSISKAEIKEILLLMTKPTPTLNVLKTAVKIQLVSLGCQ